MSRWRSAAHGHAVELVVGVHHRAQPGRRGPPPRTGAGRRRAARGADVRGRPVETALGGAVADEVLGGGDHARRAGRRPAGPARTPRPWRPRGMGPRRTSPRCAPSVGRGRRRAPATGPGGRPRPHLPRTAPPVRRPAPATTCWRGRPPGGRPSRPGPSAPSRSPRARWPGCRAGSLDQVALDGVGERRGLAGVEAARPGDPGDLPDARGATRRRRGPASSAGPSASWKTQALPSWASFSSSGHAGEQVGDAIGRPAGRRRGRPRAPAATHRPCPVGRPAGLSDDERRVGSVICVDGSGALDQVDQQSDGLGPSAGSTGRSWSAAAR